MLIFEIKKILKRRSTQISLFLLVIWVIGSIFFITNKERWTDDKGQTITGIEAINAARDAKSRWNGLLTDKVVDEVISLNKDYRNNSDNESDLILSNIAYAKTQEYEDIRNLINRAYGDFSSYDYYTCDSLEVGAGAQFYENRIEQIKAWLNSNEAKGINEDEKQYYIMKAQDLKSPFIYSYMDGWKVVMDYLSLILLPIVLIVCILLAPVFAGEYQSGSVNILLSSKYGRNKVIYAKIIGSFIVAAIIYFCVIILYTLGLLTIYGFDGYQCPIQANSNLWKSFYEFTNFSAYLRLVFLGFFGCLLMVSITIFASSVLKTSFSAIIISFIIIIIPQMINTSSNKTLEKMMALMPHETFLGSTKLAYYTLYSIFDKIYTPFNIIPILYLIVIIILIPFIISAFRKHQD